MSFTLGFGILPMGLVTLVPIRSTRAPRQRGKVFAQCKACHQTGETAKNAVGPALNGVIGRAWNLSRL
jgi:cytochrome c